VDIDRQLKLFTNLLLIDTYILAYIIDVYTSSLSPF